MLSLIKNRITDFTKDSIQWSSCLLNVILCGCMAYFYYDSSLYAPLFYSIFFFAYIFTVFLAGAKCIPLMYLIFILASTQNITFINCTGFFLVLFLTILYPKQRVFLFAIYALDIFLVCFRHSKTVWHLLCHFAFCVVFYLFYKIIRQKIKNEIENEIKSELEQKLRAELTNQIKIDLLKEQNMLILDEVDKQILNELASGAKQKEITGLSENSVSKRLKKMREKNGIETNSELLMRFLG